MAQDTAQTIDQFIDAHALTMDVEAADGNPHMDRADTMHHYACTIRRGDDSMEVIYSMGSGLQGPPQLADVLDTLASDVASVVNASGFDDWATEMGYFPMESSDDYNRAQDAYSAIDDQRRDLARLLGDDALETLLWETERQ